MKNSCFFYRDQYALGDDYDFTNQVTLVFKI